MGYAIGIVLAPAVSAFARWSGLDRDRAFYPTVLIVVASYYLLFAAMAGSVRAVAVESIGVIAFAGWAVVGFKKSMRLVAIGLAGYGVFDFVHPYIVSNPGVPEWWPAFCASYDVVAGTCLAWLWRKTEARS